MKAKRLQNNKSEERTGKRGNCTKARRSEGKKGEAGRWRRELLSGRDEGVKVA